MGLKVFKPYTPSRRGMVGFSFDEITKKGPEPSLVVPLRKKGGRNNQGRITARHRGGGHKRLLRILDFKRNKLDVVGTVDAIEYDPNRSARIALVQYDDGEKRYMLAPLGLGVGDKVSSGAGAEIKTGNALPLRAIPVGTTIHNIELHRGKGGQMVRSAGGGAQLMAKESRYAQVRLPSGEVRRVDLECYATIGQVGNVEHGNVKLGKAGRTRWLGWKPKVRGLAMSPRDHPHGGGEGRSGIGMSSPKSPWGKPTLGYRTRRNKRTDPMIIKRRK